MILRTGRFYKSAIYSLQFSNLISSKMYGSINYQRVSFLRFFFRRSRPALSRKSLKGAFSFQIFPRAYACHCSFFYLTQHPPPPLPLDQGLLNHKVSRSHSTTQHNRYDSSGRVIGSSQRPLPDNTNNRQISMPSLRGIRTYNLSRQAASESKIFRALKGRFLQPWPLATFCRRQQFH